MFVIDCYEVSRRYLSNEDLEMERNFTFSLMELGKSIQLYNKIVNYCNRHNVKYYSVDRYKLEFSTRNDELKVRLACL